MAQAISVSLSDDDIEYIKVVMALYNLDRSKALHFIIQEASKFKSKTTSIKYYEDLVIAYDSQDTTTINYLKEQIANLNGPTIIKEEIS